MPIKKYPSKTHLARVWVKLQTFQFRNLHCKQSNFGSKVKKCPKFLYITVSTTQVKLKGLMAMYVKKGIYCSFGYMETYRISVNNIRGQ
jgi:hypothetical protein